MGCKLPTSANMKQGNQAVPTGWMRGSEAGRGNDQLKTLGTSRWAGEECGQEAWLLQVAGGNRQTTCVSRH